MSATKSTGRSIVWFRRDLRLTDHPALAEACAAGSVLPLFVIDPTFEHAGAPRRAFLCDALQALDDATEGALVVRHGDPVDEIAALAEEVGADTVYVSGESSPYGRRRDEAVDDSLRGSDRRLRAVGSPYAVDPGVVVKPDGSSYAVFTPFFRAWQRSGYAEPVPSPKNPDWIAAPSDPIPERPQVDFEIEPATEASALARWRTFRDGDLDRYHERRNFPAERGTSELSPFLKFGLVHPRQLLAELDLDVEGHHVFASELAWRDFYADVLWREPQSAWANLNQSFDRIELDTGAAARAKFRRWCEGTTGFPIVDAGMRQLLRTGWMHNRVRMVVASFLVKDLHLPWWWGARYFLQHLLDGDLASNNHGWQWAAGTGTDAAPYFRVFNPTAQMERWDPTGAYVHRWIPEFGSDAYPAEMVDHRVERLVALDRYRATR